MVDVEFLENERKKIWARLIELEEQIKKKTSDYEHDAKQASKKCSEYKNKCESAKGEVENLYSHIQNTSDEITKSNILTHISEIQSFHNQLSPKKTEIETHIIELEELFENYATYSEKLEKLDAISESAEETATKSESILDQLALRKKEVDKVYFEIFGHTTKDETSGIETKVIGKKEELSKAYTELKNDFENFSNKTKTDFENKIKTWEGEYSETQAKIESLLPTALTVGLSAAHAEKVDIEKKERAGHQETFYKAIKALTVISIIPFGIMAYMLLELNMPLLKAIELMPNITFSIALMYIPALWVAVSASKKINLSKRLIEEYTHKEVVSRTYQGLSKQIEGIEDRKVNAELKANLLRNILLISVENPGKLISGYNQSDHPILDKLGLGKALNLFGKDKGEQVTKPD